MERAMSEDEKPSDWNPSHETRIKPGHHLNPRGRPRKHVPDGYDHGMLAVGQTIVTIKGQRKRTTLDNRIRRAVESKAQQGDLKAKALVDRELERERSRKARQQADGTRKSFREILFHCGNEIWRATSDYMFFASGDTEEEHQRKLYKPTKEEDDNRKAIDVAFLSKLIARDYALPEDVSEFDRNMFEMMLGIFQPADRAKMLEMLRERKDEEDDASRTLQAVSDLDDEGPESETAKVNQPVLEREDDFSNLQSAEQEWFPAPPDEVGGEDEEQ
jgi:hypothetical protein